MGIGTNRGAPGNLEIMKIGSTQAPLLVSSTGATAAAIILTVRQRREECWVSGLSILDELLDVAGNIRTRGTSANYFGDDNKALIQASAATAGDMKFLTNNMREAMRITNSGNVGIGTTTPVRGLTVMSGNVGIGT